jgi:hypothetical protein
MLRRLLQLLYTLLVSVIDGLSDTQEAYIDQKRDTTRDTPIGPASLCSILPKGRIRTSRPAREENADLSSTGFYIQPDRYIARTL